MIDPQICEIRSKALEERILSAERHSDERDAESEQVINRTVVAMDEGFKSVKKDIKDINTHIDELEKSIPETVSKSLDLWLKTGLGKCVIYVFKTVLIGGVSAGVIASIAYVIKSFLLGGWG